MSKYYQVYDNIQFYESFMRSFEFKQYKSVLLEIKTEYRQNCSFWTGN